MHLPVNIKTNQVLNTDVTGWEYAEHSFLGDAINLTWDDGATYVAAKKPFTLPNQLQLTYGQISGLAGDFYGTVNPISNGNGFGEQAQYFKDAFGALAYDTTRQPKEARKILSMLQVEVDAINEAVRNHESASAAYAKLSDKTAEFQIVTLNRGPNYPSYMGLAYINFDHFGADARTAYNVGHQVALDVAAAGDLQLAYAMNAFADHFLQDSFSAGHLRAPRRALHKAPGFADLCAMVRQKRC